MPYDPSLMSEGKRIAEKWSPVARSLAVLVSKLDDALGELSVAKLTDKYETLRETFTDYMVENDRERRIAGCVFDLYARPGSDRASLDHALSDAIDAFAYLDEEEIAARLADLREEMERA